MNLTLSWIVFFVLCTCQLAKFQVSFYLNPKIMYRYAAFYAEYTAYVNTFCLVSTFISLVKLSLGSCRFQCN